jgi:hypothetical protein
MLTRKTLLPLALILGIGACSEQPTDPTGKALTEPVAYPKFDRGTGLTLDNVTSTPIPLLGDVVFNGEVVITQLALNAVGGLEATGTITGTITALGIPINQNFTTDVGISKTGSGGQCGVLTLDLAPINVDVLGQIVSVDLTAANIDAKATGTIGTLLCTLTSLLNSAVGGAVNGVLNALNGLLGGGTPAPPPVP